MYSVFITVQTLSGHVTVLFFYGSSVCVCVCVFSSLCIIQLQYLAFNLIYIHIYLNAVFWFSSKCTWLFITYLIPGERPGTSDVHPPRWNFGAVIQFPFPVSLFYLST